MIPNPCCNTRFNPRLTLISEGPGSTCSLSRRQQSHWSSWVFFSSFFCCLSAKSERKNSHQIRFMCRKHAVAKLICRTVDFLNSGVYSCPFFLFVCFFFRVIDFIYSINVFPPGLIFILQCGNQIESGIDLKQTVQEQ